MIIAVDDTYGPTGPTKSRFVTGARRTHVGVVFADDQAAEVREQLRGRLEWAGTLLPTATVAPREFHFVDIYNGTGPWAALRESRRNLALVEAFCNIYSKYRWWVIVQTVDDRTIGDVRGLLNQLPPKIDGLNLKKREELSLFLLCLKIKAKYKRIADVPLTMIVDEGRRKRGTSFGDRMFADWPTTYTGYYASSANEGLLQIADLLAFCINRATHLAMKEDRTETDHNFLHMVSTMRIRSDDIAPILLPSDFSVNELDRFHELGSKELD
jgi:hypothetical protein